MKPITIIKICVVLCISLFAIKTIKSRMIVVQGSIQLWAVTIINETGLTLPVVDTIIDPHGESSIVRIIPSVTPNNQFTFQWPSTFEKPNARKITIGGDISTYKENVPASQLTVPIILGNTPDATHPMVVSGDFTIIKQGAIIDKDGRRKITLCVEDKFNKGQCAGR